ncbi:MAG TPA: aldo/keto reductase [Longimicrobiales bacterium]
MSHIQRRPLGRTGVDVSCIGVGGAHLTSPGVDEKLAVRIVREALDAGIDFLDNSWDYGKNGQAERRMGRALKAGYRERAFLMTKIDGRSRRDAAKQLDQSLDRLGVDCIDLVQHHEVIRFEDVDRIFHDDGANRALLDARDAGKLRFIGFTGHKDPAIHLRMLELARANRMRFDACQLPLNVMDAHFRSFEKLVLPELVKDGIAVLGMKSMGSGVILKSGSVSAQDCLRYALSLPTSVVITGIDSPKVLAQAIDTARHFTPLGDDERADILARTRDAALTGSYELFKTSTVFDATTQNPEWLGEEPEQVQELAP